MHPGSANSLDALCARYNIDNSRRTKHGALLDAELLAEVYLELTGGRQARLSLDPVEVSTERAGNLTRMPAKQRPQPLPTRLTAEDQERHGAFIDDLGEAAIWNLYRSKSDIS